jgi:hypothetical protein
MCLMIDEICVFSMELLCFEKPYEPLLDWVFNELIVAILVPVSSDCDQKLGANRIPRRLVMLMDGGFLTLVGDVLECKKTLQV